MTTTRILTVAVSAMALSLAAGLATLPQAKADSAQARTLLKAMSDCMAAQNAISFSYDTNLEVATTEGQMLAVASSGDSR